ncbi:MAG: hypothetical protein M0P22_00540, partial [Methanoculleus sp.]|nr:hypothetical protein [Methanoculleus sp.]
MEVIGRFEVRLFVGEGSLARISSLDDPTAFEVEVASVPGAVCCRQVSPTPATMSPSATIANPVNNAFRLIVFSLVPIMAIRTFTQAANPMTAIKMDQVRTCTSEGSTAGT